MATNDQILPTTGGEKIKDDNSSDGHSFNGRNSAQVQAAIGQPWWPVAGYGPLARHQSNGERLPAFGGEFQPGLYKPPNKTMANPAPLGLAGFALTTFLLSLINLNTRGVHSPSIIVAPALAYGGLIQLLAGMWYVPVSCANSCHMF